MLTNPPCDPLPRARAAHVVRGADGRARREQLLRHLHATVAAALCSGVAPTCPGAARGERPPAPRAARAAPRPRGRAAVD